MRSQGPGFKVENIEQGEISRVGGGQPPNPSFVIGRGEIGVQNPFSAEVKFFHPRPRLLPCAVSRVAMDHIRRLPPGTASVKGILHGKRTLEAFGIRGHMEKLL